MCSQRSYDIERDGFAMLDVDACEGSVGAQDGDVLASSGDDASEESALITPASIWTTTTTSSPPSPPASISSIPYLSSLAEQHWALTMARTRDPQPAPAKSKAKTKTGTKASSKGTKQEKGPKSSTGSSSSKSSKSSAPSSSSSEHKPPYIDMIKEAISQNGDKKGLSRQGIKKFMIDVYHIDFDLPIAKAAFKRALDKGVDNGELELTGGTSGKFRFPSKSGSKRKHTKVDEDGDVEEEADESEFENSAPAKVKKQKSNH